MVEMMAHSLTLAEPYGLVGLYDRALLKEIRLLPISN